MGRTLHPGCVSLHFWAPEIDPAHPLECTHAERYVLRRLDDGSYIALQKEDQSLQDVSDLQQAYFFHTHEAALRAAIELQKIGSGRFDVVKID
jgi:hypothetical protein